MRYPITYRQSSEPYDVYLSQYKEWLSQQNVSGNTLRVYHSRVKHFLVYLEYAQSGEVPLADGQTTNEAVRHYLHFLKQSKKGNSTVNANINALKSFCQFLGITETLIKREKCYPANKKILNVSEEEKFLQVVAQQNCARDKAIALILFSTGLRIGDCARLNMENISSGAAALILANGNKILLNTQTNAALKLWLEERQRLPNASAEPALWLSKYGERLQIAGITCVIERIGWQANLLLSAETLRRTWLSKISDQLNKENLAMQIGSYVGKSTMKRYGISLALQSVAAGATS